MAKKRPAKKKKAAARGKARPGRETLPSMPHKLKFQRRLMKWYDQYQRDLPWRRTTDPYRILVSEIMLQQTQVVRVQEFYTEFLDRYPTLEDCHQAPLSAIKQVMDPLGYKNRSRYLKETVSDVMERYGGRFPEDEKSLRGLKGVGRYTAGALRSFAFRKDAPILDTNVARVLARVFLGLERPPTTGGQKELWAMAEKVIPRGKGYIFNQALMDFGAMCCTAQKPKCLLCPMQEFCGLFHPPVRRRPAAKARTRTRPARGKKR